MLTAAITIAAAAVTIEIVSTFTSAISYSPACSFLDFVVEPLDVDSMTGISITRKRRLNEVNLTVWTSRT
jgi:hypothetical protein